MPWACIVDWKNVCVLRFWEQNDALPSPLPEANKLNDWLSEDGIKQEQDVTHLNPLEGIKVIKV